MTLTYNVISNKIDDEATLTTAALTTNNCNSFTFTIEWALMSRSVQTDKIEAKSVKI